MCGSSASSRSAEVLSYRHAFHAGSHADVLKHVVLVALLRHLAKKDKAFWVIDTHAGPALHALREGYAAQRREFESGIGKLWQRTDAPAPIADYLAQVRAVNAGDALAIYPGSAALSLALMRKNDRLRLFELHPTEVVALQNTYERAAPRVLVQGGDGFTGLQTLLPPPPRRGLVFIDPSYEDKHDYRSVVVALREGLTRFATGIYAVWYPQVHRQDARELPAKLKRVQAHDWLHASLTVKAPSPDGLGLDGSGVFVINPPFTLAEDLRKTLPYLTRVLGQDGAASWTVEADVR